MMGTSRIRLLLVPWIAMLAFCIPAAPAYGTTVDYIGNELPDSCITSQSSLYIALDSISDVLGLTVLNTTNRIIIGNTIHGTISVDPSTHQVEIGGAAIDYSRPLVDAGGRWYAPPEFIELVLGVGCRFDAESDVIRLYPKIISIIPDQNVLRIESSAVPDFRTFELTEPSRRVIDIENALISGTGVNVTGTETGLDGVAAIRVGQWSEDPPIVRVVLEWDSPTPPQHSLFPDGKKLAVLIGSSTVPAASNNTNNFLQETVTVPAVDHPAPPAPPENPNLPPVGPEVPSETPPASPQPEVDPAETHDWMTPDDFPEGAEDFSLSQLGWNVSFQMDAEGEIVATLRTPPFETSTDFTLAGDGMRLVVDILGTYLPGNERTIEGIGDIERVRFGQFQPNTTRIVFDVSKVLAYEFTDSPDEGRITVRLMAGDISSKTIVIDPGHGGEDPGAVVRGLMEKDINLEMAYFLKEFLEELGATVFLTRETDVYVTLADRLEIARQHGADLFICIHNNATEEPTAIQGCMLLYNNDDFMDLYRQVHRGVAARTGVPGLGPVEDERGLYILRHAEDMPVVFVEAAFMTNAIDFARLTDRSRTYSSNIMAGVMDGVLAYYAGRQLDPVVFPDYGDDIETGVFDLAGRSIVLPRPGLEEGIVVDDDEESTTSDSENSDDTSAGDDDGSGDDESDDDDESDYHRLRGRGAYRYR